MNVSGHRKLLLAGGLLAVIVAGAALAIVATVRRDPPAALATFSDDPLVTCGSDSSFQASKLPGPDGASAPRPPLPADLDALVSWYSARPEVRGDRAAMVPVSLTESAAHFVGRNGEGYTAMRFTHRDGAWQVRDYGGCSALEVAQPGLATVGLVLDVRQPISPSTTELRVFVENQACDDGKETQASNVVGPAVHVDADRIVLTAAARRPSKGMHTCPQPLPAEGPPGVEVVVKLDGPVGDRVVLDGTRYPYYPFATWDGEQLRSAATD